MGFYTTEKESKRWFVMFFCLVIGIFAAVDLTECRSNYFCYFVNIAILLGSVFGAAGAYRMDAKLLGWFIILCMLYVAFEVGYIIWGFAENHGARSVLWNFILVFVLLVTMGFARDLRAASGAAAPLLGTSEYGVIP